MIDLDTLLKILIALVGVGLILLAFSVWMLVRRIKRMESLLPRRHTHRNAMTLENVLAFVIGAQARNSEQAKMLESLRELLANMRQDPNYFGKE